MKFTILAANRAVLGTIDITEDVYLDDEALLNVLADAGHVDRTEALEVTESDEKCIDIFDYETNFLRISLELVH